MGNNRMTFQQLVEHQKRLKVRKKPGEEEHRIQCACVNWFRLQYPTHASALFAVPNGGRRDKATGGKLKAEGALAGVSDLILLIARGGYHGLLIEMKKPGGKQQPSQRDWQRDMTARGYRYIVCHSFDEFREQIDDYLLM
ncbi:MAG: VRR-NUC domain-containing protein [Bacteroidales bacterium]|nr:VRR-NUC domain-containing protein [Bacteroidales bacterium]